MAVKEASLTANTIERFGSEMGRAMGWPPTAGRILGSLMLHEGALSIQQLQAELGASAGAISECARTLDEAGVIRRVKMPASRQIGYVYREDAWLGCLKHQIDIVDRLGKLALSSREEQDDPASFARSRFEDMRTYYEVAAVVLSDAQRQLNILMRKHLSEPTGPEH